MFYTLLLLYVLTTSGGLVALKLGSGSGAFLEFISGKLVFNFSLMNLFGVLLYGVSFLLYIYLIAKNDLGYIVPLTTALVYAVVFIASFLIFKESFTFTKIAAIVLILSGLILLNIKN